MQHARKPGTPGKAELSPINPYASETSADGKGWPELDTVRPWDSLTADEKRLLARMAEEYAGFLSHADHQIGPLLDYLEQSGQIDNTGGPNGSVNENKMFNGIADSIEANLPRLEELGSPDLQPLPGRVGVGIQHPCEMWNGTRTSRASPPTR